MPHDKKINDFSSIAAVLDGTQFETDTGGITANKATGLQIRTYVLLNRVIGTDIQAFDENLEDIAALGVVADNEVMVGTGAGVYAFESGATLRTSIGALANIVEDTTPQLGGDLDGQSFKIGLGTTSPDHALQATGNTLSTSRIKMVGIGRAAGLALLRVNNTEASPNAVTSGNKLGLILFQGHDGTVDTDSGARITAVATENWTASAHGTKLQFRTVDNTTISVDTRMTINQNGHVGIGIDTPDASALLDISSTTLGVLLPRLTTAERDAIGSPVAGLTIYNTTTNTINTFDSAWAGLLIDNVDVTVAQGGTGASDAPTARTNLGLVIGTDVQAEDPVLTDLAALSAVADNEIIVGTGAGVYANESGATLRTSIGCKKVGLETLHIPATAMTPATTSGAATGQIETTTNKVNIETLDFDKDADEFAHFTVDLPKAWNAGTVTFNVVWTAATGGTTGIAFGLQAVSFADNDSLDTAYGTAIVVTDDAQTGAFERYKSATSAAVTIAGAPVKEETVHFRLFRDVSDANDDLNEDAVLIGINVFYTVDAEDDA